MPKNIYFCKDNLLVLIKSLINCDAYKSEVFGEIIVLSPEQAFRLLSSVESYLLRDNLGDQYFGLFELFNHACTNNICDGLMIEDRSSGYIKKTRLDDFKEKYPRFFSSKIKIIFIDDNNSPSTLIDKTYSKLISSNLDTSEYLLVQINTRGSNWEHIFEYLLCEYYISQGYIVDTQLPWSNYGTPDIGIYKINQIQFGFHLKDLISMQYTNTNKFEDLLNLSWENIKLDEFTVGEIKTFQNTSQIKKFNKTGWPTHSIDYIMMENLLKNPEEVTDILSFNYIKKKNIYYQNAEFEFYAKWFILYIQLLLLASLGKHKMFDLISGNKDLKLNLARLQYIISKINLNDVIKDISLSK